MGMLAHPSLCLSPLPFFWLGFARLGDLEEAPIALVNSSQTLACDLALVLELGLAVLDVRLVRKVLVGVWALEIRRGVWHDWLHDLVVQPALVQDWLAPLGG